MKPKNNYKIIFGAFLFLIYSQFIFATWEVSSYDYASTRASHLEQINKDNLKKLKRAWVYNTGEFNSEVTVQSSPIYTGKYLITVGLYGSVFALDPENGKNIWTSKVAAPAGRRGIVYSKNLDAILVPTGKGVSILNGNNGSLIRNINSGATLTKPILHNGKLMIATLKNGVKAYNINSGELLWHNSLNLGDIQTRIWSGFSYDINTGTLLLNTANPGGLYGGNRVRDDLSTSLIAVNSETGKIIWQFQHIIHDVWDLDLVGDPIIINDGVNKSSVLSFSKTGDLIFLDIASGKPIFKNSIVEVAVPQSDVPGEILSKYQKNILIPESVTKVVVDIENDFSHLNEESKRYVKSKLKYAKSQKWMPPSLNYDTLIYGLHGGPQWMGGALSYDQDSVVVPFNKDPWLLRLKYQDSRYSQIKKYSIKFRKLLDLIKNIFVKFFQRISNFFSCYNSNPELINNINETNVDLRWANFQKEEKIANMIYKLLPNTDNGELYEENCASCHGVARQGNYENEYQGDYYVPPLIGISKTKKGFSMLNYQELKEIHSNYNEELMITSDDLDKIYQHFIEIDQKLEESGQLSINYAWQFLLDKDGYPASKPPWGGIAKLNLKSGKILWSIPFGMRRNNEGKVIAIGDKNYGGVMSTKSNLIFASGTPDRMARAFDMENGEELWSDKMPFTGSAQPMSYMHNGCQFIAFVASGGQFVGFEKNGDALVTYKLNDCHSFVN